MDDEIIHLYFWKYNIYIYENLGLFISFIKVGN